MAAVIRQDMVQPNTSPFHTASPGFSPRHQNEGFGPNNNGLTSLDSLLRLPHRQDRLLQFPFAVTAILLIAVVTLLTMNILALASEPRHGNCPSAWYYAIQSISISGTMGTFESRPRWKTSWFRV